MCRCLDGGFAEADRTSEKVRAEEVFNATVCVVNGAT
jgi:hypothetical protein